ncbi:unnamed protein product [Arabis nemorensis]|uniref:Uncharacterized protein n=1 Tax=Arabis nemorensis TaxID=586526 RepID=A0A565BSK1_9BRAS|nr:unnamed protein product [Arabis nemorensis]
MMSSVHDDILIQNLNNSLKEAYKAEEAYWRQRNWLKWLCLGDQNSSYFHAVTRGRRCLNRLSILEDEEGTRVYTEEEITQVIQNYFHKIFTTVPGNRTNTRWR